MKNKFKLLLFILIVPFMCINVDAKEITQEEYMNIFANEVEKQIDLDKTFAYYLDNSSERDTELQEKATGILTNMNTYMVENELEYTFESAEIQFNRDNPEYTKYVCSLKVDGTVIRLAYGDVVYKNHENYSDEDNELINSIFTDTSLRCTYALDLDEMEVLSSKWALLDRNPFYEEVNELIEGTGITYRHTNETYSRFSPTTAFMSASIYLFKNDVYYKTVYVNKLWECTINVPDEVEKTVEAYSEYGVNELREKADIYPESTIELIQGSEETADPSYEYDLLIDEMFYGTIPVVNNDRVLLTDNFQVDLDTSKEYVYATTITEENKTSNYSSMIDYLNEYGFTNIVRSYYINGNKNTRKAYFYFDNSFNGKELKILGINNGIYQELDATVENGMITAEIFMNEEVIIALKEETPEVIETITFNDIVSVVSGYYSSEYTANELENIKYEIEKTIKEEITAVGVDYAAEGYNVSLENENGWFIKISNKNGEVYTKEVHITPKTVIVEETGYTAPTPVAPQTTTHNTSRPTNRRYTYTRPVETTNAEETGKVESTEEDNTLESLEDKTTKEKSSSDKKETTQEVKEDSKDKKEVKEVNTLPIKIIIGSVIVLIIGGGVYYVRSRYY